MLQERIRNRELLKKVVSPEKAAGAVQDGMNIATSGDSTRGYPAAFFSALAERARRGKVKDLSLWSVSLLGYEVEGVLAETGALKRRLGSHGDRTLRKFINSGQVLCNDIRTEMLPYLVRSGTFGKLDLAVIDAAAITEEGYIIPSHAPIDIGSYAEAADQLIIEIDGSLPPEIEGMYDHYLPELNSQVREIPIYSVEQRIGTPYIPVPAEKIKYIVISEPEKTAQLPASPATAANGKSQQLAEHLIHFLKDEIKSGRLPQNLYPIEIGLGSIADAIVKNLINSDFENLEIFSPVIGDGAIDLIDSGKCRAATGTGLLISDNGWGKFCSDIDKFKKTIILRPCELTNHPELVRRLKVIAINGAIEVDIYGHVNSSHISGVNLVNGIGGSSVFASNGYLSIFSLFSINKKGTVPTIVPMVGHVDHTEHCVDVVVTEIGLADLRGLSPVERAEKIIQNCAHPDYRPLLEEYLARAKKEVSGHEPHILAETFSFQQRFKERIS